jgi:very-short-patch-repair endonuclease
MTYYGEPLEYVTGMPSQIGEAVVRVIETSAAAMEISGATDSPIEEMFGGALIAALRRLYGPAEFGIYNPFEPDEHPRGCLLVETQYEMLRFRYDFALRVQGYVKPFLLIECDGKAFHSSPAQIANDRRKDECAFRNSIPLLRFKGSDIHYHIDRCVSQVIDLVKETK